MKNPNRRISILSLPEVKEYYSIPIFNAHERDYFFNFTDEELKVVKGFHSHRNRIHFLLMMRYFKVKSVCLIYNWKDVEVDYQYLSEHYFPKANREFISVHSQYKCNAILNWLNSPKPYQVHQPHNQSPTE